MEGVSSLASEDEVSAPVVFQCIKCNVIIGDSFAIHSTNPDEQTITLSAASHIKRCPELFTSYNGHDIGSTYIILKCSACEVSKMLKLRDTVRSRGAV
jgi:hypothetical protein